ncbi:hypothetical protein BDC45DRAFT_263644 [Circinella umbellata]|nr:hypothetical protein BDC45DRAFT_263644 [Circinella umbellata]
MLPLPSLKTHSIIINFQQNNYYYLYLCTILLIKPFTTTRYLPVIQGLIWSVATIVLTEECFSLNSRFFFSFWR